jgi:L-fuconolactonase
LQRDIGSGHNIEQTIFLECYAEYKKDGPKHMRSVGEGEFVSALAEESSNAPGATFAAIVGNADVVLGDGVEEVLMALDAAVRGRFRIIRYSTAQDVHPPLKQPPSAPMDDANYLQGVRRVVALGYSYDAMIYHPQLPGLVEVARACPDAPIVINHHCGILGTGPYKDQW